jgi:small-conductance mechanosensitive channel
MNRSRRPSDDERAETKAASGVRSTPFIWLGTTASMVAAINSIVAGAAVALLAAWLLGRDQTLLAACLGIAGAAVSMGVFLIYQRRRFDEFERAFFGRVA